MENDRAMIKTVDRNRFEVFFSEDSYTLLKNHLYNYMLRKKAVENTLKGEALHRILEVGSGISPLVTPTNRVVYTDISPAAVRTLKNGCRKGCYVVADCTNLPFKQNIFSHAVCSEVLEHISDDMAAIEELSRILQPSGRLIVTFPHRKFYLAIDDRLVGHFRRYEIAEMEKKMRSGGFIPLKMQKVLGPLEKLTMMVGALGYIAARKMGRTISERAVIRVSKVRKSMGLLIPLFKWANRAYAKIAWLDAKLTPRVFSTVLLMKCALNRTSEQITIDRLKTPNDKTRNSS